MINQSKLKKFAVSSRTKLIGLVSDKIDYYAAMDSTKAASLSISSEHSSLMQQLEKTSRLQLAEQAAYTWFNRFVALRFMDANDYTHPKIVTPQGSQSTIPEILQDAIGGIVPNGLNVSRQDVLSTLGDTTGGKDPQGLAYRKLLLASCNKLSSDMPEMFEQISDYTELLLPDDLLSAHTLQQWSLFFLISIGRGTELTELSPGEAERVLIWAQQVGRGSAFRVKTTEAMHYRRLGAAALLRAGKSKEDVEAHPMARAFGIRDGNGIVFVSNTGDVTPSGFLPLAVGNVKDSSLVSLYRDDPVLRSLRDPDQFKGRCGTCEYRDWCGGSRAPGMPNKWRLCCCVSPTRSRTRHLRCGRSLANACAMCSRRCRRRRSATSFDPSVWAPSNDAPARMTLLSRALGQSP